VAFDPSDDGQAADARCVWSELSAPTRMPGLVNTANDEWFPAPAANDTQLFFHTGMMPSLGRDLWFATRPDRFSTFGVPQRVVEIATTADEVTPSLTSDGLVLVYSIETGGPADLWLAQRSDPNAMWDPPAPITNNAVYADHTPAVSADGLRIVSAANYPGSIGGRDLFEHVRGDRAAAFGTPIVLEPLTSLADDSAPALSPDGLELVFASGRSGGPGGYDPYYTRRASLDQPFEPPVLLAQLATPFDDYGFRFSDDGAALYFNYDTATIGGRNADVWIATRTCQ